MEGIGSIYLWEAIGAIGEIVDAANFLSFIFEAIDERVLATRAIAPRLGVAAMKPHPLEDNPLSIPGWPTNTSDTRLDKPDVSD